MDGNREIGKLNADKDKLNADKDKLKSESSDLKRQLERQIGISKQKRAL